MELRDFGFRALHGSPGIEEKVAAAAGPAAWARGRDSASGRSEVGRWLAARVGSYAID